MRFLHVALLRQPVAFAVLAIALVSACGETAIEAQPRSYVGIGVELTMEAAGARVVRILPGSGAKAAGLSVDDTILEVSGVSTRGLNLAEVVAALRGEPGTTVEVLVRSHTGDRALMLTRRALKNP
jgi:C-terminal processing protease CtpA/Prc